MKCLLATVQFFRGLYSVNVAAHSIYSHSQQGLFGVYRFYVKAVNPNITFGARDFYVLSVLLDSICFCIFVLGFSSFGVRVYTCMLCVHLCVHARSRACVWFCVCSVFCHPAITTPFASLLPHPCCPSLHPTPSAPPSILIPSCPLSITTQLGQGEVQQVATYIQQSTIPLPFLIVLLLQFLSMLMDRVIYLRKSIPMKLIFNVFLIIIWHAYLFFILPSYTNR